ncbi:hypothetical protein ASG32_30685 [Methylobacterium sp. Leaf361]|uniref:hypothetical protein n=1 Tax=Methylobacterium sp. Leaf361 TaxID=1736352 RepID=UPI0006F4B9FD|nr:hypothetical protein [Methylobacterium sp. Leaf361]KQS66494.1 hypothetical protein ASG32_30685 [Methylobacterium sp. Leaf361]
MADTDKAEILGGAIMAAMQTAILDNGMSPQAAFDTALMAIGGISIQAEGEYRTGAKLILIGQGLVDGSPEGVAKRGKASN